MTKELNDQHVELKSIDDVEEQIQLSDHLVGPLANGKMVAQAGEVLHQIKQVQFVAGRQIVP